MPSDVSTAIAELWIDSGILEAFRRTDRFGKNGDPEEYDILLYGTVNALMSLGSFLNSIQRVTQKDYQPSLGYLSRASMEDQDVRNVMIPRKSAGRCSCYRFIDTVESSASGDLWIDASEDIPLVFQVVDLGAFDVTHFGGTFSHDSQRDVVLFKRVYSSR